MNARTGRVIERPTERHPQRDRGRCGGRWGHSVTGESPHAVDGLFPESLWKQGAHGACGCITGSRSLTLVLQTSETMTDLGVLNGGRTDYGLRKRVDPDLQLRTVRHWPDTWH